MVAAQAAFFEMACRLLDPREHIGIPYGVSFGIKLDERPRDSEQRLGLARQCQQCVNVSGRFKK